MKGLNPNIVAQQIGLPLGDWGGNCHAVSTKMVKANLVPGGVVTRGMWIGEIALGNVFSNRMFTGHSWIETPDGTIVDPTRWVFMNEAPKIYIGPYDGNYDKGGNWVRQMYERPYPSYEMNDHPENLAISAEALERIAEIAGAFEEFNTSPNHLGTFSKGQLFWICNLDPNALDEHAWEVYTALDEIGWRPGIPIDNWNVIMGGD